MSEKMQGCIFCDIANKKAGVPLEYEDDSVAAFNDKSPRAPVHILIVPKTHVAGINGITGDTEPILSKMAAAAKKIAEKKGILSSGYRLVVNCGKNAGEAVGHLHMHLLGGRLLGWPPG